MKKGFTLVELLAVIVILAVIALITIPAVMKMIDNATTNSYRRSIDLYGGAVNNAIIEYQTDMVEKGQATNVTFDNIEPYIEYEGNEVDCKLKQIYSDKTILLTECYVEEELVLAEKNRGYGDENYYYYTNSKKKMKVIEYIKAVEEEIQDKNITGTCTISEDKLTCNGQDFTIKSNLENAIDGTLTIENNKVKSYSNLKFETEKKVETNNEVPQVIDEIITAGDNNSIDENDTANNQNNEEINNNTNSDFQGEIASLRTNYTGYYADVDADGNVDGIIYADLAYPASGNWYNSLYNFTKNYGEYSYTLGAGFKEYLVSEKKYKSNNGFGENKIITTNSGSGGNTRFYVMALNDFISDQYSKFYLYKTASGKINVSDTSNDFGTGYRNTGKIIQIWNKNGIGEGSYLGATQDNQDIFKYIQSEYNKNWYIPSRAEWAAFAHYLSKKGLSDSNYDTVYNLSKEYWTSSFSYNNEAWIAGFNIGCIINNPVSSAVSIRLSINF